MNEIINYINPYSVTLLYIMVTMFTYVTVRAFIFTSDEQVYSFMCGGKEELFEGRPAHGMHDGGESPNSKGKEHSLYTAFSWPFLLTIYVVWGVWSLFRLLLSIPENFAEVLKDDVAQSRGEDKLELKDLPRKQKVKKGPPPASLPRRFKS